VGGDEHQAGRVGEPADEAAELEPAEPRHADVEEDPVEPLPSADHLDHVAKRGGAVGCGGDVLHPRVLAQQVGQLVQGGNLIVDGQDTQHAPTLPPRIPFAQPKRQRNVKK